jgi:excisionase family DNA binding protein
MNNKPWATGDSIERRRAKNGEVAMTAAVAKGNVASVLRTRSESELPLARSDSGELSVLDRIAEALEQQAEQLRRLVDHFKPSPADIVDSVHLAERLGCTTSWIAQMARRGEIPGVVAGTGNGKPWKFYRTAIEQWVERR